MSSSRTLPGHSLHGVSLILLYLELEFHDEDEASIECEIDQPAYKRNTADEDAENGICAESDEKEDSVVNMMSDERAGLIGIDEKSEEPEHSEIS